jgi:glucose-1-phosphate thymidylyltransferase
LVDLTMPLFAYPHDIIRYHVQIMPANLNHRLPRGEYRQLEDGVFLARLAELHANTVCRTDRGPIVIDEGARIGPFCVLEGPLFVGANTRISSHAVIKDSVALGHTTKVGGEIVASIIEDYSNNQHDGFLGHAYLGSWINLGAGTCNSDLKNTYGEIRVECQGRKIGTGMQFFGCVIGDYTKTAIQTSIFTGKMIGACSMIYGWVTSNVPSFVNYARTLGQVTELPPDVMVATQQRMFARRGKDQRPCDIQLIHDIYDLVKGDREVANEPLSL